MSERIITIQRTPKIAKLLKLAGVVLAIFGAVALIVGEAGSGLVAAGTFLLGTGVAIFICARILAWWRSG